MGMYDTYEGIQLKAGNCSLNNYSLEDRVPLDDGVYFSHEGVVIVRGGRLLATFDKAFDKWGNPFDYKQAIEAKNPISKAIAGIIKGKKDE